VCLLIHKKEERKKEKEKKKEKERRNMGVLSDGQR
jgi:hypothetical protein